jgi:hypothetical protein
VSGRAVFAPLQHPHPVRHAEFSPDGSRLVTCFADELLTKCDAQVWDAATGRAVGLPLKHGDGVRFASFSPDGRRVVTASEDFTAIIWDAATGRQLTPALQHGHQVQSAAFSPDGKWVVTASSDRMARVWNAETGDPLTPPMRHVTTLVSACFLADGRRIATSDNQGEVWTWELAVDERPLDDLQRLALLLSGDTVAPSVEWSLPPPETLGTIWQRLRTQYPAEFSVSSGRIAAWHESQAQDAELGKQWRVAAFHLQQLLLLRPGDPSLVNRLAAANRQLPGTD